MSGTSRPGGTGLARSASPASSPSAPIATGAKPAPKTAAVAAQSIRWNIHVWAMPLIFFGLIVLDGIVAIAGHAFGNGKDLSYDVGMPLAVITGTGLAIVAIISLLVGHRGPTI